MFYEWLKRTFIFFIMLVVMVGGGYIVKYAGTMTILVMWGFACITGVISLIEGKWRGTL